MSGHGKIPYTYIHTIYTLRDLAHYIVPTFAFHNFEKFLYFFFVRADKPQVSHSSETKESNRNKCVRAWWRENMCVSLR